MIDFYFRYRLRGNSYETETEVGKKWKCGYSKRKSDVIMPFLLSDNL